MSASGLVVQRFDATPWRPAAPGSRFYAVDDATPALLAWIEGDAPDTAAITPGAEVMAFTLMRDVGDTAAPAAPWLYVVHTDVPDDIVDGYNAWYDEEHLPRLVRVPGILRARRYAAHAAHPRYLTAYDLQDRESFQSPAAVAARRTPWTERMRALFTNTRRFHGRLLAEG